MKRIYATMIGVVMAVGAMATAPTFPGGEGAMKQYIAENLEYPQTAKDHGVEGVINLTVAVKADGSIGTIKIDRLVDTDLEQEAIRLVKNMPLWNPAEENGQPVDGTAQVSIVFELN